MNGICGSLPVSSTGIWAVRLDLKRRSWQIADLTPNALDGHPDSSPQLTPPHVLVVKGCGPFGLCLSPPTDRGAVAPGAGNAQFQELDWYRTAA